MVGLIESLDENGNLRSDSPFWDQKPHFILEELQNQNEDLLAKIKDEKGNNLLYAAAKLSETGSEQIIDFLAQDQDIIDINYGIPAGSGGKLTPLHAAIEAHNTVTISALLENGADPSLLPETDRKSLMGFLRESPELRQSLSSSPISPEMKQQLGIDTRSPSPTHGAMNSPSSPPKLSSQPPAAVMIEPMGIAITGNKITYPGPGDNKYGSKFWDQSQEKILSQLKRLGNNQLKQGKMLNMDDEQLNVLDYILSDRDLVKKDLSSVKTYLQEQGVIDTKKTLIDKIVSEVTSGKPAKNVRIEITDNKITYPGDDKYGSKFWAQPSKEILTQLKKFDKKELKTAIYSFMGGRQNILYLAASNGRKGCTEIIDYLIKEVGMDVNEGMIRKDDTVTPALLVAYNNNNGGGAEAVKALRNHGAKLTLNNMLLVNELESDFSVNLPSSYLEGTDDALRTKARTELNKTINSDRGERLNLLREEEVMKEMPKVKNVKDGGTSFLPTNTTTVINNKSHGAQH